SRSVLQAILRNFTATRDHQLRQLILEARSAGLHSNVAIQRDELYIVEWRFVPLHYLMRFGWSHGLSNLAMLLLLLLLLLLLVVALYCCSSLIDSCLFGYEEHSTRSVSVQCDGESAGFGECSKVEQNNGKADLLLEIE
ncbi:hypothetical protein BOX15_Mlig014885g1, partial [Macrostomum lignano]